MSLARRIAQGLGPRVTQGMTQAAPQLTASFVQQALERAIRGVGPFEGAASVAERVRRGAPDAAEAVTRLIEAHVRMAGAQGFVTNIGGLAAMPVSVPANIGGLAMVQCRLVAAVAHLRGYDLEDRRVRNAVLVTLLGEEKVDDMVGRRALPGPPMALATAPVHDPGLDPVLANEVAAELMTRVAGKRLAYTLGRRTPVVGGVVGAGTDAYATWQIGRYADRELLPRNRR